jgi:hypothetical protein
MTRSALTASGSTASGDLVAALRRFRTRARTIVFLKELFRAVAIGGAATMVWNVWWGIAGDARWTALVVTLAGAVAAALLLTYLRGPTLMNTAAAIDRRLQLRDRVVAALQVSRDPDPVSALVVRDALVCLRATTPADVFPVDFGQRAAAGALLLTSALLTVTIDLPGAPWARQPGIGTGAMPNALPTGAAAEGGSATSAATAAFDVRPAESRSAGPSARQQVETLGATAPSALVAASTPSAETEAAATQPAASESDAAMRLPDMTPDPRSSPERRPGGGEGSGPGGQSTAGTPSRAALGAMPAGAGGSTPDIAGRRGRESGGVAAGPLVAGVPVAFPGSPRATQRPPIAAAVSRARIDAAVSRDDIPFARRQYVRDYFLRLRSTGGSR